MGIPLGDLTFLGGRGREEHAPYPPKMLTLATAIPRDPLRFKVYVW